MENSILDRYKIVKEKIEQACIDAGRRVEDVQLVIVTKGFDALNVLNLEKTGNPILGENYPEETVKKIEELKTLKPAFNPVWHMIGHLQSRKIKYMSPNFAMIQSIDSVQVAEKVNSFYKNLGKYIDVLVEINIAGEITKSGFTVSTLKEKEIFIEDFTKLKDLKNINIKGLMCMPPYAVKEDQNRRYYEACYGLREELIKETKIEGFAQLSMGTSADFQTAIHCGATMVRVGEAIMGRRVIK